MKKTLYRAAAATVLGLSLATTGVAAANPVHHGSHHHNGGSSIVAPQTNNVSVSNSSSQVAQTGSANVSDNGNGDHHGHHDSGTVSTGTNMAMSGDATNGLTQVNKGSVTNTAPTMPQPTSSDHHDDSPSSSVYAPQTNNITIDNSSSQVAQTGSANVSDNSNGGSAISGDATNTAKQVNNFTIGNN